MRIHYLGKWTKACLVCSVAATFCAASVEEKSGTYAYELASARKVGLPTRPEDMKHTPVREVSNAAPFYRKLVDTLRAKPDKTSYEELTRLLRPGPVTAAQIARAKQLLTDRQDIVALMRKASLKADCDFQRDWTRGPYTLFPEFSSMRTGVRWLSAESGLLLRERKPMDAVSTMAHGFSVAKHARSDDTVTANSVSIAIVSITMRGLENVLYQAGEKAFIADSVRQSIDQQWRPMSINNALRGEIFIAANTIEQLMTSRDESANLKAMQSSNPTSVDARKWRGKPITPAERAQYKTLVDKNGANVLHAIRELMAAADKPYPTANKAFLAIKSKFESHRTPENWLAAVTVPVYEMLPERRASDFALAGVMRSAASVLGWKTRHGEFPDRLEDAIKQVPVDPFDMKPLRYRLEGKGFVVYSVGVTGRFDGRAKDRKQHNREAVFAYPAPAFLPNPAR